MTGFSIQEVRVRGTGMLDAVVRFGRGLSLLTGPSDTGKSFVADAINHVFGAQGALRQITEQGRYDRVLVEISVFATGHVYTLERAWAGGAIQLYASTAAEAEVSVAPESTLKESHDATTDSVSGFLLELSGLGGKLLRKNASGGKDSLSFRNLTDYILVDEERIISKESPTHSGQYLEKTKETSLFKLLLTGQDDSAINTTPDAKTRRGLEAGRQEVLDSLVQDVRDRIAANKRTEEALRQELSEVEDALVNHAAAFRNVSANIQEQQQKRKELWETRQKSEARTEQVRELIKRFTLLDAHYNADIARLESTQESGHLLVQLSEGVCPLCGADPANHRHEGLLKSEDVAMLTEACEAEQRKLQLLKSELAKTLHSLKEEDGQLSEQIGGINREISSIQSLLSNDLQPNATATKGGLDELLHRRGEAERSLAVFDELRRLEALRSSFETKSANGSKKPEFATTPVGATDELAALIGEILTHWQYPNLDRVVFDSTTHDIIINGKHRASHGKGYRAITYSAFMVGMLIFCRRKNLPHPGFVILDSPLVTYQKPDVDPDDLISEGMVSPFYKYLADLDKDCQVLVIENEEPTAEVRDRAAYVHFTRNASLGRYGFLLG